MSVVAPPVSSRVSTSIDLRPIRSPKCPKIAGAERSGNEADRERGHEASVPANGENSGKKTEPNAKVAAMPKM